MAGAVPRAGFVKHIITSDVHLGNIHSHGGTFLDFLQSLPDETALVLNGDTIDRWQTDLPEEHLRALDLLREESRRRSVIWLRGNHDETYVMDDPGDIEFRSSYAIGKRLFIAHGHDFDNVMPFHRGFIWLFRVLHQLRIWLGAESVHVAHYAKKFPGLYRVLQESVAQNAVEHARENGYEAVTCGHTHLVDDRMLSGVRYINTGSWTEVTKHYILADENEITLKQLGNGVA